MGIEPVINDTRRRRREASLEFPPTTEELEAALLETTGKLRNRFRHLISPFTYPLVPVTQNHYRRVADTFAEDADGVVHIWNGIDKPLRFEASVSAYETEGVIAPTIAPVMGSIGSGPIVGDFYAYVRFVDRDGNFSSLSPVSAKFTPTSGVGTITGATNAAPIVLTVGNAATLTNGQTVKVSGVQGNTAANGIFSVQQVSSSTVALYEDFSLTTPVIGNGTYISGGTLTTGVGTIVYSNVAIPTESKVVRRQILRNQDGDTSVFYIDIDTTDLTSDTFKSQTTSDSLTDSVSLENSAGTSLVDMSVAPDYKKIVAFQGGRMFAAGNENYAEGAVVVTNGSKHVTGIGTEWGPITFGGRFFEVVGGSHRYTIDYCDSTTSLYLTEAYAGTTDPYALYVIHVGDGERRTIYWSGPSQPEAWPITNTLTLAEDPNAGEITALMAKDAWLYIITENRTYRFSWVTDPLSDGFVVKAAQRGSVNNRCIVQVEDIAFMLDPIGIHAFAGNDDQNISSPAVQDMFRTKPCNRYKINWNAKKYFHAVYNPGDATVRWFVSLDTNDKPYHAICYCVRTKRWWLEQFPWPIYSSCLGRLNGKQQVYLGTTGNRIMAMGLSTVDGPDGNAGGLRGSVTSAGVDWIADTSYAGPSAGVVGNRLTIVRGKGKGQERIIHSVSNGTIYVTIPWTDQPDTTSKYQIGAISWHWETGWMRWAPSDYAMNRAISVHLKTTVSETEMFLRVYHDLSDTPETYTRVNTFADSSGMCLLANDPTTDLSINTMRAKGYVTMRVDDMFQYYTDGQRVVAMQLFGYSNADQQIIYRFTVDGASGK